MSAIVLGPSLVGYWGSAFKRAAVHRSYGTVECDFEGIYNNVLASIALWGVIQPQVKVKQNNSCFSISFQAGKQYQQPSQEKLREKIIASGRVASSKLQYTVTFLASIVDFFTMTALRLQLLSQLHVRWASKWMKRKHMRTNT